jgi:hypothetical protein
VTALRRWNSSLCPHQGSRWDALMLSRKLFENVNSLFANESDGYKTTSAPSAFRFSCGRNARTGQESTPEQSECHLSKPPLPFIETAIKKIYLTDVAAVIEESSALLHSNVLWNSNAGSFRAGISQHNFARNLAYLTRAHL